MEGGLSNAGTHALIVPATLNNRDMHEAERCCRLGSLRTINPTTSIIACVLNIRDTRARELQVKRSVAMPNNNTMYCYRL